MADKKMNDNSKIDAFYQWLAHDIQKMRTELSTEMKLSSAQVKSMYDMMSRDKNSSSAALEQEIRYSYKQNQNIYEGLATMVKSDVAEKINEINDKLTALEKLEAVLSELGELKYSYQQLQSSYEGLSSTVSGEVVPKLDEIATKEETKELVEESVSVHSQQVLDALAAIPAPEAIEYDRITQEVGDKVLEILNDLKANEEEEVPFEVDYEKIAGDTSAKVIESMPFPEQFDYKQIDESIANAVADAVNVEAIAQAVAAAIDVNALAEAVAAKIAIPEIPAVEVPEVDYNQIADLVVEKLTAKGISADVILDEEGIDRIADTVAEKVGCVDPIDYDKVCLAAQAAQILPDPVDYDRVGEIFEDKLVKSYDNVERVIALDEEGIEKIVGGVADELKNMTLVCEYVPEEEEAPVEEEVVEETPVEEAPVEEIVEEPVVEQVTVEEVVEESVEETSVEEVVEEIVEEAPVEEEVVEESVVEEVIEEAVEETPVEEPVTEEPVAEEPIVEEPVVEEELAASAAEPVYEEDNEGQLIDAETGLVVRLKRSFTAKMKQSEEQVKVYYSDIKNALTSYKRINSNVSWHGDRFNYGRDTVAKIGINGKTLCFYLALDPSDPELKTTVYHQKDVGEQKAYENTPFMVKVKSDAAAKKALRLVEVLANKLGAEPDEGFEEVDYVAEYAYESTKRLFEQGDIKATKEKKVDFNF